MKLQDIIKWLLNPVLWIAVALIVAVVFLVRWIKKANMQKQHYQVDVAESYLKKDAAYYKTIADQLEFAMDRLGTRFGDIMELLQGLNTEELKRVYNEFGVRENYQGAPTISRWAVRGFRGNLIEWFRDELSGRELNMVEDIFKPTGLI